MNNLPFKMMASLKAAIQSDIDIWQTVVGKAYMIDALKHGDSLYNWSSEGRHALEALEKETSYSSSRHPIKSIDRTVSLLRLLRKETAKCDDYNPMFNHRVNTRIGVNKIMSSHFKTVCFDLDVDPIANLENTGDGMYSRRVMFSVPWGWCKSVERRGVAVIKSGKGKHLVTKIKPTPMPWVDDEGMLAFKCSTIFFKNKRGEAMDGWLVMFKDGSNHAGNPVVDWDGRLALPHAFHQDLRRSVSLLNSRTFRSLSNML
jgi:hypothetical protein